jgi:hypothetical protein
MLRPDNQALQVFYGTVPLILVILGLWFPEQMLLRDILRRLAGVGAAVKDIYQELGKIRQRLVALETRAGIVFRSN